MRVEGTVRVPGDKSISHRVLFLSALAHGKSEVRGLLSAEDVQSTAALLRRLGVKVSPVREGAGVTIHPRRLSRPAGRLQCGNSGTAARLALGVLAGQRFPATLTGDASLRRRPMRRVTEPLRLMGARITESANGTLPVTIRGGRLQPLVYRSPVASAQVKSAILFAGLTGRVAVTVEEPYRSRDHTERLFVHLGLDLHEDRSGVRYEPSAVGVKGFDIAIPGDISSAAFLVAAAALAEGGELLIEQVGVNPTRTGCLAVLERMGVHVERLNLGAEGGEPVADLLVRPAGRITGTEVAAAEIPSLVDEVPILAVVASRASGDSVFREVGELRVKESNRLELIAANLRAVGAEAEVQGDDLHVRGNTRLTAPRGRVDTARDHRLAMAFGVLGTLPGADVKLSERRSVGISFPGFFAVLKRLSGNHARHRD